MAKQCVVKRNENGTIEVNVKNYDNMTALERAVKLNKGYPMDTASNGEPSLLYQFYVNELNMSPTEAEYVMTNMFSPEFGEWFGRWWEDGNEDVSHVRDDNGQPKPVWSGHSKRLEYHYAYTNRELENRADNDAFFPENKRLAQTYSNGGALDFMTLPESLVEKVSTGSVEPVFLNIRNEKEVVRNNGMVMAELLETGQAEGNDGFSGGSHAHPNEKVWSILDDSQVLYINGAEENDIVDEELPSEMVETGTKMAPNGNPSNLTDAQWEMVRTPEFIQFFGDWLNDPQNASQIVDENGEPMVVYHGTNKDFNVFEGVSIEGRKLSFFTPDIEYATGYSLIQRKTRGTPVVMGVFLNIRDPKESKEINTLEIVKDIKQDPSATNDGYRGVDKVTGRQVIVSTQPGQIKSIENTGRFSKSENIYLQIVGEIGASKIEDAEKIMANNFTAKEMESEGKDTKTIRMATGWEKGADGKWRYEIPDMFDEKKISLKKYTNIKKPTTVLLSEFLPKDSKILQAYPISKATTVTFMPFSMTDEASGSFNPSRNNIIIYKDIYNDNRIKEILAHELQHLIQIEEGFAQGGNKNTIRNIMDKIPDSLLMQAVNRLIELEEYKLEDKDSKDDLNKQLEEIANLQKYFFQQSKIFRENNTNLNIEYDFNPFLNTVLGKYAGNENTKKYMVSEKQFEVLKDLETKGVDYKIMAGSLLNNTDPKLVFKDRIYNIQRDKEILKDVQNRISKLNSEKNFNIIYDKLSNLDKEHISFAAYKRLSGEVEARNVSDRLKMSNEERLNTLLQETEDIPREEQIQIFEASGIPNSLIESVPQEVLQEITDVLTQKRLVSQVNLMTPQELRQVLEEMGLSEETMKQIEAWHGSPHLFDRFSTSAIGTGEGNQAFGWGLYFTDLKEIAENYAKKLSGRIERTKLRINGEIVTYPSPFPNEPDYEVESINELYEIYEFYLKLLTDENKKNKHTPAYKEHLNSSLDFIRSTIKKVEAIQSGNEEGTVDELVPENAVRKLYNVSLHQGKTPEQYTWLEWDIIVPLNIKNKIKEQAKKENFPERIMKVLNGEVVEDINGAQLYEVLQSNYNKIPDNNQEYLGQKEASLFLLRAGIDGVKYPAESISRGATSDNARGFNYVVFDENAVAIQEVVQFQNSASIKPGVEELFQENPELANTVYEALGFKTKTSENEITRGIKEILPFKVIGDYSNIEEGLTGRRQYSTAIDGNNYVFDISTYSYENEDGTFQSYYDIDFTVNGSEDIIGTGFFDKSEKAKQIIQAIISENYGNDTIRFNVEESKKGKQRLLLYKRLMNQLGYNPSEEMEYALFYDIKTDKVNLTPQQKQQAQQLYSEYLDTIFPDSKVKNIVYHGSPNKEIQSFLSPEKEGYQKQETTTTGVAGVYFSDKKSVADIYQDFKKEGIKGKTYSVLLNLKKPIVVGNTAMDGITEGFGKSFLWNIQKSSLDSMRKNGIDGIMTGEYAKKTNPIEESNEYAVFEPEQIHILGSKQDIEGFKDWKSNKINLQNDLEKAGLKLTPNGFYRSSNRQIYLNSENPNILETTIHEFAHPFLQYLRDNKPAHYQAGVKLLQSNQEEAQSYIDFVKQTQPTLKEGTQAFYEEVLAQIVGDNGAKLVNSTKKNSIREWLKNLWETIGRLVGITKYTPDEISRMTLEEFSNSVVAEMMDRQGILNSGITLSVLEQPLFTGMRGRSVSPQTISNAVKGKGIKQIERDIITSVLELPEFQTKKINYNDFELAVKAQIMPLERIESDSYADFGSNEIKGNYNSTVTMIYNSPLDHGITGHFRKDYDSTIKENQYITRGDIVLQNETDYDNNGIVYFAAIRAEDEQGNDFTILGKENQGSYYKNSPLTEDEIYTLIDIENKRRSIFNDKVRFRNMPKTKGLFGHTRVWTKDDVYNVAEVQSDVFQKDGLNEISEISNLEFVEIKREKVKEINYEYNTKLENLIHPVTIENKTDFSIPIIREAIAEKVQSNRLEILENEHNIVRLKQLRDEVRNNKEYDELENEINRLEKIRSDLRFIGLADKIIEERYDAIAELDSLKRSEKILTDTEKQFLASEKSFELRLIRESVQDAANRGFKKLRLPLPYTLSKIEGYLNESGQVQIEGEPEIGEQVNYFGINHKIIYKAPGFIKIVDNRDVTEEPKRAHVKMLAYNDWIDISYEYFRDKRIYTIDEIKSRLEKSDLKEKTKNDIVNLLRYEVVNSNEIVIANHTDIIENVIFENISDTDIENRLQGPEKGYPSISITDDLVLYTYSEGEWVSYKDGSQKKESFKIEALNENHQPIARRYEAFGEMLKKERPSNFRIVEDENGYPWYETDILEKDKVNPVLAFQKPINISQRDFIPSQLFEELSQQPFLNQEQALDIYQSIYTEDLNHWKDADLNC